MCYVIVLTSQCCLYSVSEYKPCKVGKAMNPRAAFWPSRILSSSGVKFRFSLICIFQPSFQFILMHALLFTADKVQCTESVVIGISE